MPAGAWLRFTRALPTPASPGPVAAAALIVLVCLFFAGLLAYFVLWFVCIRRAFRAMFQLPYTPNRRANFVIRIQVSVPVGGGCNQLEVGGSPVLQEEAPVPRA